MKKICAIFAMMAMMVIMPTGCRAQNEASTAEQSSSVQSSSVLEETAENSEEEKDAVQFSENGTSLYLFLAVLSLRCCVRAFL